MDEELLDNSPMFRAQQSEEQKASQGNKAVSSNFFSPEPMKINEHSGQHDDA